MKQFLSQLPFYPHLKLNQTHKIEYNYIITLLKNCHDRHYKDIWYKSEMSLQDDSFIKNLKEIVFVYANYRSRAIKHTQTLLYFM